MGYRRYRRSKYELFSPIGMLTGCWPRFSYEPEYRKHADTFNFFAWMAGQWPPKPNNTKAK